MSKEIIINENQNITKQVLKLIQGSKQAVGRELNIPPSTMLKYTTGKTEANIYRMEKFMKKAGLLEVNYDYIEKLKNENVELKDATVKKYIIKRFRNGKSVPCGSNAYKLLITIKKEVKK